MGTVQIQWNPRYVQYARLHGNTPEEMMIEDAARYPGGKMCGFMLWTQKCWRLWAEAFGHPRHRDRDAYLSPEDHKAFDAWLESLPDVSACP